MTNTDLYRKIRDKLNALDIQTTAGELFTGECSALLANLIWHRFGRDWNLSLRKWQDMLGNSCPMEDFKFIVEQGEEGEWKNDWLSGT